MGVFVPPVPNLASTVVTVPRSSLQISFRILLYNLFSFIPYFKNYCRIISYPILMVTRDSRRYHPPHHSHEHQTQSSLSFVLSSFVQYATQWISVMFSVYITPPALNPIPMCDGLVPCPSMLTMLCSIIGIRFNQVIPAVLS